MLFSHADLTRSLEWTENHKINELIIEAPVLLRNVLRSLALPETSQNSKLAFSEQGKIINIQKDIDLIYNPLKLDFNNRRAIASLLKSLLKTSLSEDFYLETNKFKTKIIKYLDKIIDSEHFAFELTTNDFGVDNIAKAIELHIVDDEDDYVELLTDYLSMMTELVGIKLFVFFNLRTLVSEEEMARLRENLKNHDFNILLIESRAFPPIPDSERIIVDTDLCEL